MLGPFVNGYRKFTYRVAGGRPALPLPKAVEMPARKCVSAAETRLPASIGHLPGAECV